MLPIIEQLLVLQDRDRRMLRLKAELDTFPGQRQLLQTKAARAQEGFDEVRKKSAHTESERKRMELEVETLRQRIAKLEIEQQGTRSNDQYKTFQHQIGTIRTEIAKLDDQQLELMEQGELMAQEVKVASKGAAEQKAESDRIMSDLAAREEKMRKELELVSADRARLAADIDPVVVARYDRILKSRGDNIVVGVDKVVCGGCHMKLPMQSFVEAKGQQAIVHCPHCTRILYFTSDMAVN